MPVRRFRSVHDMPDEVLREPGTPELAAAIRRVWDFAARTCRRRFPPGVYRYRSLEEARRQRDRWQEEAVAARAAEQGRDTVEGAR